MFGSYSFKDVNAIFGINEITGWADGDDVLNIESETDRYSKVVGAKGDVVRSASNDYSVVVTLRLLQTSETNEVLNNIRILDEELGTGVLPFIYTDTNSGESYIIQNAWIAKMPTITRGRNQNIMEWTLHGDKAEFLKEA
jgi:hypothetical protein